MYENGFYSKQKVLNSKLFLIVEIKSVPILLI